MKLEIQNDIYILPSYKHTPIEIEINVFFPLELGKNLTMNGIINLERL